MPYNLLVLPLLGGYIFISKCFYFRHTILRYDNQRLIFASAVAGIFSLVISSGCIKLLNTLCPLVKQYWVNLGFLPFDYAGTALGAFFIGCSIWKPWNVFYPEQKAIRKTILRNQDPLEILCLNAFDNETLIMLTLKSNKVYIGRVTEVPNPVALKNIMIMPSVSGYREKDTKDFIQTTIYDEAIRNAESKGMGIKNEDFKIVIPMAEIQSASHYSPEIYDLFSSRITNPYSQIPLDTDPVVKPITVSTNEYTSEIKVSVEENSTNDDISKVTDKVDIIDNVDAVDLVIVGVVTGFIIFVMIAYFLYITQVYDRSVEIQSYQSKLVEKNALFLHSLFWGLLFYRLLPGIFGWFANTLQAYMKERKKIS